jgi:hypothetical protein
MRQSALTGIKASALIILAKLASLGYTSASQLGVQLTDT